MGEQLVEIVKCYRSGGRDSTVLAIPRRVKERLKIAEGQRFLVKIDEKERLIYERLDVGSESPWEK